MPGTVRLHRVLATSPEKVYRAFIGVSAPAWPGLTFEVDVTAVEAD